MATRRRAMSMRVPRRPSGKTVTAAAMTSDLAPPPTKAPSMADRGYSVGAHAPRGAGLPKNAPDQFGAPCVTPLVEVGKGLDRGTECVPAGVSSV